MHSFYRVFSASPAIKLADPAGCGASILSCWQAADADDATLVVFPELSLTGYTCGDLFAQSALLDKCEDQIQVLCDESKNLNAAAVFGAPVRLDGRVFNCAVVLQSGKILGIVPKSFIPNYREFYEKRWFASGKGLANVELSFANQKVPFGVNLLFEFAPTFVLGIEICADLWHVRPPSEAAVLAGATVIANLSASPEIIGKAGYRKKLIETHSVRTISAYIYSGSGEGESSTDLVFTGQQLVCEYGKFVDQHCSEFMRSADIDCERLVNLRRTESNFFDEPVQPNQYRKVQAEAATIKTLSRSIAPKPFVPKSKDARDRRCAEITALVSSALNRRLAHVDHNRLVLGLSGGLDSTLALLFAHNALASKGAQDSSIVTVTMPGFGTSDRTLKNAQALAEILETKFLEVDIKPQCLMMLEQLDSSVEQTDTVFENVQARARTQYLMNLANKKNALVLGTSDLSELALGWSTFNGDHMSMYNVNCGIPKSLVKSLVEWFAEKSDSKLKSVLTDIIATPISPELVPANGDSIQSTEDLLGPYDLHDFFLYYFVRFSFSVDKIEFLARSAFAGVYSESMIRKTLASFIGRFFQNQFKRSCMPDGPKIGTISLSPRGDWRMPSDADAKSWLSSIDREF